MKKVNLRDLYPDVYKTDHFVEVTEDVLETIRDSERAEAAYPNCSSVNQMKDKNKEFYSGTREEIIAKGYSPCGNCRP